MCSISATCGHQICICDIEGDLESCQQDVVVDGIKCCREVEQGEDRQVAVVDCIQDVSQYFQHGLLDRWSGVSNIGTTNVAGGLPLTAVELPENDTLENLGHHR